MTFGKNIQKSKYSSRIEFACFSFRVGLLFFINFTVFQTGQFARFLRHSIGGSRPI